MNIYSVQDFTNSKSVKEIKINVGGRIYFMKWKLIKLYKGSRLEKLFYAETHEEINNLCDEYNLRTNEYFFDRHPKYFEMIWNLLENGQFYFENEYCIVTFVDEIKFWGYSTNDMPDCCKFQFDKIMELVDEELTKVKMITKQLEITEANDRVNKLNKYRVKLWNIMDNPETSWLAKIVSILSIVFILLSTICTIIGSLPQYHIDPRFVKSNSTNETINAFTIEILDYMEFACIGWFTLEYLLRFIASSRRLAFLIEFLNVVDAIAIIPFYVTLIIALIYKQKENNSIESLESLSKVVQVFRILRIIRVIKLARHSVGLQSLGYTLRKSYKELGLLIGFIIFGVFAFSCVVYLCEHENNSKMFPSIPGSFWWAIISMTTVGYGDVYPITSLGQFFASICCVSGVLVVAMPIPIIVSNFSEFYKVRSLDQMRLEKSRKRKEELDIGSHHDNALFLMNSVARNTLTFFHAFGRTENYLSNQASQTNMAKQQHHYSLSLNQYSHHSSLCNAIDNNNNLLLQDITPVEHMMDLMFNTDNWKYIDTTSSASSLSGSCEVFTDSFDVSNCDSDIERDNLSSEK